MEARAEERDTLGFTSMTKYRKEWGSKANCTLHPPFTFRARMIRRALSRSMWYSLLVRVWLGATTMESPVWMPTGSRFSILHTVMAVSLASRMTSYSISLKPLMLFSTRT